MDIGARLSVDPNLISDLLENLSDSSSESGSSHSDDASSRGNDSKEDNSNSPTGNIDSRRDDSASESESGTYDSSSDEYEDEEDDADSELDFKLDELDLRLARLVWKACDRFGADLRAQTKSLPLEELRIENRSELENCLALFYSKLRDQASSCLYTFYGSKSYVLSRSLRRAISEEERRAQVSFNNLWIKCRDKRPPPGPPPVILTRAKPSSALIPRQSSKLQQQERGPNASSQQQSIDPSCEPKDAQQVNKTVGSGDEKRVWNHFTISRDQTRASDFTKELLKIFRISRSSEVADSLITDQSPDGTDSESSNSDADWRGSLVRTSVPPKEKLESEGVISTRPNDYLEPALVPPLLGNDAGLERDVPMHGRLGTKMKDQPQTNASGGVSPPEMSGRKLDRGHGVRGSGSDLNLTMDGSLGQLMGRLASLETENRDLKEANRTVARSETVYFIQVDRRGPVPYLAYLDEPTWAAGPSGETVLKSHFVIHDINGFLRQKKDIAFVISKYYDIGYQNQEVRAAIRDKRTLPRAECSQETVRLQSFEMIQAAEEFISQQPKFAEEFPGINLSHGVGAPYLFWYYYRSKNALEGLSPTSLTAMTLLTSWIEESYGELYDLVEDQLRRGVISAKTVKFLVKPGDVVAWKEKRDLTAVVVESWPLVTNIPQQRQGFLSDSRRDEWGTKNRDEEAIPLWKSSIKCWQYGFDGSFYRRERTLEISFEAEDQEEEVPITKLSAYPLQYAPETWKETLDARGTMFWSCRNQRIASYEDDRGLYGNSERFMVDFHTYEQLHSDSNSFKKSYATIDDPKIKRMDPEVMESDTPPPVPDLYVFPNTIPAYNLRSKKWVDLEVDQIRDVTWNKKSFEHLVVDIETKDLIQALITNQIARGQGTDTIDGKGNGLIILLHGGPGTGKTFTAESVAEMAEKPLFRVTCGDIGTKPEEVEKYLESVLHLGKNWGCVVLLDEADVFLEQRTLTDLERNALVSVFLRVLEYYEGILILTSNRVGTFDEAFKSRIQLSLHYENLTEGQRGKIWKNFLSRLKDLERQNTTVSVNGEQSLSDKGSHSMGIDFDDVECYLSDLARVDLNGRQIRNAITTARQLAKFKGELMAYHHLRHVIKVSSKFDSYLKNVQEGFSDDQIARGGGIR